MSFMEIMQIPFYKAFVDLRKDGKYFIYSSNKPGTPQLYLKSIDVNSEPKQLTFGKNHVNAGYFSPKGDKIVYPVEEEGNELYHLYLITLEDPDNEPKRLSNKAYNTDGIAWHPNNTEIARAINSSEVKGVEIFDLTKNDSFFLCKVDTPLGDVIYSRDGKWVAYAVNIHGGKGTEIHVVNRADPEEKYTYSIDDYSRDMYPSFSPDGKWISFMTNAGGTWHVAVQEFQGSRLIHLDLEKEEELVYYVSATASMEIKWHPDGIKVYYVYSKHSRSYIRGHSLDGIKDDPFSFPKGEVGPFRVSGDGKIIVSFHSSMTSPSGIYLHEIGTKKSILISPKEYSEDLLKILSRPESIWYESFDGCKIHGWYLQARGASPDTPTPAIVYIHGGPADQVFDEWTQGVYFHAFTQYGYSVFAINYRGSTGYGVEFQNLNKGDYGGGDLEDVAYAAKWLRTRLEVDPKKIMIAGGSYGGYMTLMALTKKPEVFNAGISLVPLVDWEARSAVDEDYFIYFEGTAEEKAELYRDRSPIYHVSNIKAPVMIIAGTNDARCPIEPIRKFVDGLKEMNHPHEYIEKTQDGHTSMLESADERIKDFLAMMEFLTNTLS